MRGGRLSRRGVESSRQDASSDPVMSEKGKWSLAIYAAMPYNLYMVFIETSLFTKLVYNYLIPAHLLKKIAKEIEDG
jgi:hypothetical protein